MLDSYVLASYVLDTYLATYIYGLLVKCPGMWLDARQCTIMGTAHVHHQHAQLRSAVAIWYKNKPVPPVLNTNTTLVECKSHT